MQKQPKYGMILAPINLPEHFPFRVEPNHTQKDEEINDLHIHDCLEFGYCHDGDGIFIVENKVLPYSKGDISVISSAEMHLAQSTPGTTSTWTWFYCDPMKLLFPSFQNTELLEASKFHGPEFNNIIRASENSKLSSTLLELIQVHTENDRFFEIQIISNLCLFFTELHKKYARVQNKNNQAKRETETLLRIQKAIVYISAHYREDIKIEKLASLCHLSPNHFRRLFGRAIGLSPIQYLNTVRITMASTALLQNKDSISNIAYDCGYDSISSFNRQFKTQTGISPREFRKR